MLNAAGSSRLIACPVLGHIHSPALGSIDFSIKLVSRQGASSSPTASSSGIFRLDNQFCRSCSGGRKA